MRKSRESFKNLLAGWKGHSSPLSSKGNMGRDHAGSRARKESLRDIEEQNAPEKSIGNSQV